MNQEEIKNAISKVIEHGQFILGPEVFELENQLAAYTKAKHCITVSSGTTAIQLALMALDIGLGHEVITTPYTFAGTAEAIILAGAKPVFVDIDPETFLINPEKIEQVITPRTRAILPVSLFGQMADLDLINQIAVRHNLSVIEDAAQSFGATQKNCKSTAASLVGITSFYPTKPLGCYGDGGAVFTSSNILADRIRALRHHGQVEKNHHVYVGLTGRLDTIQAAILLVKLRHFETEILRRQRLASDYQASFSNYQIIKKLEQNTHVYAQFGILSNSRDVLKEELLARGLQTSIHYPKCLHLQPAFAYLGYKEGDFPCAEKASSSILCLPMYHA
ncbi:MAG: DegT/DnrJ/EryC1/StrS family aminotransferase [Myxococcaceae bacterium]